MAEPQQAAAPEEEQLSPAEEQHLMRIGKRCYVGNLAWKTSWQDLKDTFRECGSVVYANVMRDDTGRSKGWGIVEFESPEEAVKAVESFNGTELAGRKILVREDREDRDVKNYNRENGIEREAPPRSAGRSSGRGGRGRGRDGGGPSQQYNNRPPPRAGPDGEEESSGLQVVVQGIPWKYTWRELKPLFEECGAIARADVAFGRDGRSRGYGTVRFESNDAAQKAIEDFNGYELEGRTLTVRLDRYA